MPGGRPTKYSEELLIKAEDYLITYKTDYNNLIPSVPGLACALDIVKSTIYKWGEEKPEFSDLLARLQQKQEMALMDGGLGGIMNSNIVKLVLSKHGYSDKQAIDHTTNGESIGRIERVVIGND